ncbi:hypothetical protein ACQE34_20830 [Escherichia coli]|uniref:hypothetical protein n=1 Tax=Escherichia TaxID=561 RepID=UPI0002E3288D|nr:MULTISPECIES: hypothetical protein [Escherichia]EHZ8622604.1 hypothetical protein [Salmonella enterica]EHK2699464.1 hypothetical protein [Escherichia coli]EIR6185328.1 hypothetical protein [Escherichia coli]EJZ1735520.1 hypothetical protein [Escherichia coli]EKL2309623.1 hypothetical protein [Escherichia coli]
MAVKSEEKTSADIALKLKPIVEAALAEEGNIHIVTKAEALFLLMQLISSPMVAADIIRSGQVCR